MVQALLLSWTVLMVTRWLLCLALCLVFGQDLQEVDLASVLVCGTDPAPPPRLHVEPWQAGLLHFLILAVGLIRFRVERQKVRKNE